MWQMLIPMAAGALMSAKSAERKADQQRKYNLGQAEITRYSPWTGMTGKLDNSYVPSQFEAALGGAVQGAQMGQSLQGAFGGGGSAPTGVDSSQMQSQGGSYLGGNEMANDFGDQYSTNNFNFKKQSPYSFMTASK